MLFKAAYRNLLRNVRRTVAVTVTVAAGVGGLFCFDGFNVGIMNQYRDNTIHARYAYGQVNTGGYLEQVFEKPWEHWMTDSDELESFLLGLPEVEQIFPRVSFSALLTNGRVTVSGMGQGVVGEEEADFFHTLNVVEGATLSDQVDGILLGKGLARALDVKPGDTVTVLGNTVYGSINGLDTVVTGIFHTGSKEFDDYIFRVQLSQAKELLDTDRVEHIALGLASLDSWNGVAQKVAERFPQLESTPFAKLDEVYYQHSVDWLDAQFFYIELIILTIVLLGIFNTTSTAILERRQEIGNLRANGESRWDVMKLLMAEGALLGALGAVVGLATTFILNATVLHDGLLMPPAPGLTRQFQVMIELQSYTAFRTFFMGMGASLIATVLALLRVVRQPIGELLRAT